MEGKLHENHFLKPINPQEGVTPRENHMNSLHISINTKTRDSKIHNFRLSTSTPCQNNVQQAPRGKKKSRKKGEERK